MPYIRPVTQEELDDWYNDYEQRTRQVWDVEERIWDRWGLHSLADIEQKLGELLAMLKQQEAAREQMGVTARPELPDLDRTDEALPRVAPWDEDTRRRAEGAFQDIRNELDQIGLLEGSGYEYDDLKAMALGVSRR
jgi:hypothetical protein